MYAVYGEWIMRVIGALLIVAAIFILLAMEQPTDTPSDIFDGGIRLTRPTDRSISINLFPTIDLDVGVIYGNHPGHLNNINGPYYNNFVGCPINILLEPLRPGLTHFYRVGYRVIPAQEWKFTDIGYFITSRSKGEEYTFTVTSDEHLFHFVYNNDQDNLDLFDITIQNIINDVPDFHFSTGDTAMTEIYSGPDITSITEAKERYLILRRHLAPLTAKASYLLALGNHEGEQGWYGFEPDSIATWSLHARKMLIPGPEPGYFYSGNNHDLHPTLGLRQDYYSFEWGDALFVVLNPYSYTENKPHEYPLGGPHGSSLDSWDWTLGKDQYDWLYNQVTTSSSKWKFILMHQLTSSTVTGIFPHYGRGGAEIAKHHLYGDPSHEWGGEDPNGELIFSQKRPGWEHGPIHDFLVEAGADVVIHGHDHFFAYQELDGIVYQLCPRPCDKEYLKKGLFVTGGHYYNGTFIANCGHLSYRVTPDQVVCRYIRSYLPGDGENGEVAFEYIY
jgi:hypothetical protein